MKQNKEFRIIGITGGIGSGKSTFSSFIKEMGYYIIDADIIAREVLENYREVKDYLQKTYGDLIFNNGILDRKKLGAIVFSDKKKLSEYEDVIMPKIKEEINKRKNDFQKKYSENKSLITNESKLSENMEFNKSFEDGIIFLDAPILYEYEKYHLVEESILVDIPMDLQIKRVMKRDNLDKDEVLKRINNQMSREEKLKRATYVVDNSLDIVHLKNEAFEVIERIKKD